MDLLSAMERTEEIQREIDRLILRGNEVNHKSSERYEKNKPNETSKETIDPHPNHLTGKTKMFKHGSPPEGGSNTGRFNTPASFHPLRFSPPPRIEVEDTDSLSSGSSNGSFLSNASSRDRGIRSIKQRSVLG